MPTLPRPTGMSIMNGPRTLRAGLLATVLFSLLSCAVPQEPLRTVEFYSPAVDRTMRFNVALPADYEKSEERYPVLYLLHGLTSNYVAWDRIGATTYAELFGDLIVVSPDAGNSWYINYAENEDGQLNNWEDHIIEDVVGYVDANFRTIAQREGRAINGLSMGGYGGITLGLRHPEMFVSIGSTSGALSYARSAAARLRRDAEPSEATSQRTAQRTPQRTPEEQAAREERLNTPDTTIGIEGFMSQMERSPKGRPFIAAEQADAYDPFKLIEEVAPEDLPHIYLDCGTEDGLIGGARELAQVLFEKDIPFDFMQMHGRHSGEYWRQSLGHFMAIQYEVMQRALGRRPAVGEG